MLVHIHACLRRFRHLMVAGFLVSTASALESQTVFDYANGWIVPTQTYAKLNVWTDGIYRASASSLNAAGFNPSPGDLPNLQLWYRGVQQHIHVETSSGNLSYVEFIGLRNDGKIDSTMYRNNSSTYIHEGDLQPVERMSLYTDTSAYFLTIGPSPGLRASNFSDLNFGAYTPQPFYRFEAYHEYHPNVTALAGWNSGGGGTYDIYNSLNSYFIKGEGYVGGDFGYNDPHYMDMVVPQAVNLGTTSEFTCRVFGRSSQEHVFSVSLNGHELMRDTLSGIYIKTRSTTFSYPMGNLVPMVYSAFGYPPLYIDNNNYCWSSIRYDRLPDLEGLNATKIVDHLMPSNTYYRFTNTGANTSATAWDMRSHVRCQGSGNGNNAIDIVLPGSPQKRDFLVAGNTGVLQPVVEVPQLSNLSDPSAGAEFVIITHPSLMASATAYKNYRDTCSVNQLSAKVVTVDQIWDEFGHGSITPLAIKRFCKYALDNWTERPKFFFLWGKGQYETRNHPLNLVMTFSDPPNDFDFVSDFDNFDINVVPEVPIGRVNAYNDQEGFQYLEKVRDYEHTPWEEWMKHAVFLGGGSNIQEQSSILRYQKDEYKPVWENAPLGGTVNYYQKYYTGVVTNSNYTSTQRINAGCAVIHFFGHSSSNIYDVDVQEPVLYQNFGKYPLMIAYGCYGGNFTNSVKSFGERFVLEPGRGSIGYLANTTAGYLLQLGDHGTKFYPTMMGQAFGAPIGEVVKETILAYSSAYSDFNYTNHAKQINLQGDPSVRLYSPEKPDYAITESDIYFSPTGFSASDSNFTMRVVTHNLGRATQDSFLLGVRQLVPSSGTWIIHPSVKYPPVYSIDTLSFPIRNTLGLGISGINTFDVFVDSTNLIDEYREDNNRVIMAQVIPGNSPAIIYPYDFAVVPGPVKLSASAYVLNNTPVVRYMFEIDTVPEFTSPFKQVSPAINGTSAYGEWMPTINFTDSTVYYWRVRLADIYPASWAKASFKEIATKHGWAQSRPPQFFTDPTQQIEMNTISREWEFLPRSVELSAYVSDYSHAVYRLANGAFESTVPDDGLNGVMFTSIRQRDLIPTIQNTNAGDWSFMAMPDAGGDLSGRIGATPVGDYILIVSEGDPSVPTWPQSLVSVMQGLGVDVARLQVRPPGAAFVIFARKGYPTQTILVDEPNVFDSQQLTNRYDLRISLSTSFDEGTATSTLIGPASDWNNLIWDWEREWAVNGDDVRVSLFASQDGINDSLVYEGLPSGDYNLDSIDAQAYPFLRLTATSKDSVALSAPQLEHWHVVYTPAPEALIEPTVSWAFNRDTLANAQNGNVNFTVRNVSDYGMDSLLVKFAIRRNDRTRIELGTKRYAPLPAQQSALLNFDFTVPSQNVAGNVLFMIEINPDRDQPELYHFNNLYDHRFLVEDDKIQPIMDVTVDGKHLMNGDIVSPMPEIIIEVNDENRFLTVNDTAFEVHFGPKTPNPIGPPRVFIGGNNQMEGVPASLPDNKAKLYFRPGRLADGEYTLRVQGFDQAGNPSGKKDYEVNFKVVNATTISNVLNYPNPFSTSTRFVYTLTGAEIPEVFQLHIFTITGRLVKVIDLHETNDVKIGYTMSDYAWDGRDEFGDLLANGVYIYKVVAKNHGEAMDFRDEGVSQMFDNGFGKMYIMR